MAHPPPDKFVTFYTFEEWGVKSDAMNPITQEQRDNLDNINQAILWSQTNRVPVIGLGKTYTIRQNTTVANQITLRSDATVICEPGCTIKHGYVVRA